VKADLSLSRRVYTWMFDKPDSENKYPIDDKE
jgi:hypothetical protein